MAGIDAAIAERARQQLGLITTDQLDALGISRGRRRTLIANGWLKAISRGVYRVSGQPADWRRDVLGAVFAAGDSAVASHATAARLWGFDGQHGSAIEILAPHARRIAKPGLTIRRSTDLPTADLTRIGPIPVTSKIRTLIDLAGVVDRQRLELALDGALRDGLIREEQLIRRARQLARPGRPGPQNLLAALGADGRARTESWLERMLIRRLAEAGLPRPATQLVAGTGARLDAAYVDARLVIEADGHRTHSTRRQRQGDAEREAKLVAEGWRLVRFTYEDITERPEYIVATVRRLLGLVA